MKLIWQGLLIAVLVLAGILLISNLDKGVMTTAPDQLRLTLQGQARLHEIVAQVPGAIVLDEQQQIVQVPNGETDPYLLKFLDDTRVGRVNKVDVPPSFSLQQYVDHVQRQVSAYLDGSLGTITFESKSPIPGVSYRVPQKEYEISSQLWPMVKRSLSYLVPGLLAGVIIAYLLALCAAWKPRLGRWLDRGQGLLLSLPDFFIVALLQMGAILLAQAAGKNVISIMQFADTTPFVIPFLAIAILPGVLVFGAVRLAVEREWQEGYVKTAYSKGLGRNKVLLVHLLRNTVEDLLAILPRAVSVSVTSLVVAEVMAGIFGLGGYAVNPKLLGVSSLPTTCAILAGIALLAHLGVALLRRRFVVDTKEGA